MTTPEPVRLPDVADIETQLADFWRQASSDDQAVVRASTHNLIVVCDTDEDVARATETVAVLSEQHPGRVIVVCTAPAGSGSSELDAFVSTHCHLGSGGDRLCCEQVTLKARGPAGVDLVPETVLQLLEGDCPVYTWWRRPRLATDPLWEPLARLSDRCIVNSATAADPAGVLGDLAALARTGGAHAKTGDLAWVRLEAWREVIASEFDPATTRAYLDGITAVEIDVSGVMTDAGTTAAGAYLVGWLASRLGWTLDGDGSWRRRDGVGVEIRLVPKPEVKSRWVGAIRIETTAGGRKARFVAERTAPGEDSVRIHVETAGTCPLPYVMKIRRLDDAPLLCGELERGSDDVVFLEALDAAARWAAARERTS